MAGHQDTHEMEASRSEAPTLCVNQCGFFGNSSTGGLCSKCFREQQAASSAAAGVAQRATAAVQAKQQSQPQESSAAEAAVSPPLVASSAPEPPASASATSAAGAGASTPSRCHVGACRKKLGLTGFKCRCGHSFCGQHRHAEGHECTFDWKSMDRLKIAEANPLVKAAKIQKL